MNFVHFICQSVKVGHLPYISLKIKSQFKISYNYILSFQKSLEPLTSPKKAFYLHRPHSFNLHSNIILAFIMLVEIGQILTFQPVTRSLVKPSALIEHKFQPFRTELRTLIAFGPNTWILEGLHVAYKLENLFRVSCFR